MKWFMIVLSVLSILAVGLGIWGLTPSGRAMFNRYEHRMQKVDDSTKYKIRKEVEDTCRACIASYTSDVLTYQQFNRRAGEHREWADSAMIRANRTATIYNEYILKNSYVWEGNVPADIVLNLPYITEQ
jgi:hypothetical protein